MTNTMDVKVRLTPCHNAKQGDPLAYAKVTINGEFAIDGIVVKRTYDEAGQPGELFISFPAKRDKAGEWRDIAHPTTTEAFETIRKAVLDAYAALAG